MSDPGTVHASGFVGAVTFLTRVPLRARGRVDLAASVPWFPVVGALVGLAVGALAAGLAELVAPAAAAAVAVLAGVLVTGAFHEDGLADVADAFAGGWTREDRLRILDDPLHGSYGVAALCGAIVVRVAALASLVTVSGSVALAGCVAAHAAGRAGAVALMGLMPVARPSGLGADYARSLSARRAVAGVLAGAALATLAVGVWAVIVIATAAVAAAAVGWLAHRKLGGVTGDVLGAAEQVAECAVLVALTGCASRWGLWWP